MSSACLRVPIATTEPPSSSIGSTVPFSQCFVFFRRRAFATVVSSSMSSRMIRSYRPPVIDDPTPTALTVPSRRFFERRTQMEDLPHRPFERSVPPSSGTSQSTLMRGFSSRSCLIIASESRADSALLQTIRMRTLRWVRMRCRARTRATTCVLPCERGARKTMRRSSSKRRYQSR